MPRDLLSEKVPRDLLAEQKPRDLLSERKPRDLLAEPPTSVAEVSVEPPPRTVPELRAGPPRTTWDKVMSFFDDPEKESGRAVQALVDSEALGISPSQAYEYRDAIDRGVKMNPVALQRRSTVMERVKQSWETGVTQNELGEAGYRFISTGSPEDFKRVEEVSAQLPTEEEKFISKGRLEQAVRSAAELAPFMVSGVKEGGTKGAILGSGFAIMAALGGQAGPQIALPEELLTVPGAALVGLKIGMTEGVMENALRKEGGLALVELMSLEDAEGNRIDPNIARAAAFGVGAINSIIEVAQVKTLLKTFPGGEKLFKGILLDSVEKAVKSGALTGIAKRYVNTVAAETGQEIAQESVNVIFEELSKNLNNRLRDTDLPPAEIADIVDRLKEIAGTSLSGFAVMALPGTVVSAGKAGAKKLAKPELAGIEEEVKAADEAAGLGEEAEIDKEVEEGLQGGIAEGQEPGGAVQVEGEGEETAPAGGALQEEVIPEHIERAMQEPRKVPESVGTATKQQTKDTLQAKFDVGEITIEQPIRLTSVDELRNIVKSGRLAEGEDFEGRAGISAQLTGGKKPIVAYGPNDKISAAIVFPGESVAGRGEQPNEVKINPGTRVEDLRFVIDGYTELLTFEQLKEIYRGEAEVVVEAPGEADMDAVVEGEEDPGGFLDSFVFRVSEAGRAAKGIIRGEAGLAKGEKTVTEYDALKASFRKAAQAARAAYREGNKEGVAREKARMKEIVERAKARQAQAAERKKLAAQLKKLGKSKKADIAVDYQKKINALLSGIDLRKPTKKTAAKLRGLREYIESNGEPLGISTARVEQLRRLEQTALRDMSPEELGELRDTVETLKQLGKLKQRLKNKYQAEAHAEARQALIDSTTNIDPVAHLTREGDFTPGTYVKQGILTGYVETLHTPRVAEMLDGFEEGENTRYIREFAEAEQAWRQQTALIRVAAREEVMEKAGITEMSEEQEARIMLNIRLQERAFDQVNTLMDKYAEKFGWGEDIPGLTAQEEQVIDILQRHTNAHAHEIAAIWEEKENRIFPFIENYVLPIYYEKQLHMYDIGDIEQGFGRTTQTRQGFARERQKGVKRVPRVDLWGVFDEAVDTQQYFLHIQPVIENVKPLVYSEEYGNAVGNYASGFWADHLTIMARRGWTGGTQNPFMKLLRFARINLNKAILGYKASSVMMQPFAVFDGMSHVASRYGTQYAARVLGEFSKAWVVPGYAKAIIEQSEALKQRVGGEVALQETMKRTGEIKGAWQKFIQGGLSLIQKADIRTAAGVQEAVRKILEEAGAENPQREAEYVMNLSQGSAQIAYRPHVLARGELARTWFTFQTFFLNRWGMIIHDIMAKGMVKGKGAGRLNAAMALLILMAAGMAEDEAREKLYEISGGKELPDEDALEQVVMFIPRQLPAVGKFLEPGLSPMPPTMRVAEKGATGIKALAFGKDLEARGKGAMRAGESVISLVWGIPGTAQAFDLLEAQLEEDTRRERR